MNFDFALDLMKYTVAVTICTIFTNIIWLINQKYCYGSNNSYKNNAFKCITIFSVTLKSFSV